MSENQDQLFAMRHTLAHIAMQAIRRLWPDATPGVGPAIDNGFYHDFVSSHTVNPDDLKTIEKEMKKIIKEKLPIERIEMAIDEGIAKLKELGYKHTQELAEELKAEGETSISFYQQGEFINMCKGPHVENTKDVGAFKLEKIAGAYWRGDEKNEMMQRIYGFAFPSKEELKNYMTMLEEARKRDHRKLGNELDLFTFSELVGPGLPLWTPKGTILRTLLDDYVWSLRKEKGYQKVEIPHITKKDLYIKSGHWNKFKEELFRVTTREDHEFALKPMNCPHHTQIYDRKPRSYRDLPLRYANSTMVYRDEQSGELSGLSRVRCITQDDAHVFCRYSQLKDEFLKVWEIIDVFYRTFGFSDLQVRLSFSDPENQDNYLGTPEIWQKAEQQLREIAQEKGVDAIEEKGEAAFYGPKVDFVAKDSIGREWQVATIQLDMNMPEGFDLTCTNEDGEDERIVMIHAAIMGSFERFLSVIIEHFAGVFPVWLAPVQILLIAVGEKHNAYCHKLAAEFANIDIRVEVDDSAETVSKKIRNASRIKVPYMLVIGDKEVESENLNIRVRGEEEQVAMSKDDFTAAVLRKIDDKDLSFSLT